MTQQTSKSVGMDIVYLVKNNPNNNSEELRYSLRSLRNLPHRKVFIVGERPDWIQDTEFISVTQDGEKHSNVARSFSSAVRSSTLSNNFVLMNDDFFIMKQMEEVPSLFLGPMSQVIEGYYARYPEGSSYIRKMERLYEALISKGVSNPLSYELHAPMVFNKQKAVQMCDSGEQLYQMRTYYGNAYEVGGLEAEDVKVFLDPTHNSAEYNQNPVQYMEKQLMLSATGGSFSRGLVGDFVRQSFPDRSIYEAD